MWKPLTGCSSDNNSWLKGGFIMFEKLFSPITIKGMELKNRVILPAMGTKFAGKASYVTPQLVNYHVARAKTMMVGAD